MADPTRGEPPATRSGPSDRSAELLASVQQLTGVGVWAHDVAREETWWSSEARRIHGFAADEHPSLDEFVECYARADRDVVAERLSEALAHGESFEADVELTGAGTRVQSIRIRCGPKTEDGAVTELHGTVRDVTAVKRREQRIEVLRQTSQQLKDANSRQSVARTLADASKNILGLVNSAVRLVDASETTLETIVATEECVERAGERPDYPVDADNPASRVYRTGEQELYADIATSEDDWDRGELVSGIYVPIGGHGVLSAGDVVVDSFDESDLEAAALLGELGAEALTRIGWARRSRAV